MGADSPSSSVESFGGALVRSGSTALAKMAVAAQEERDAGLRDRLGGHTMPQWQEDTRIRLRYLAVALDFDCTELFTHHIRWQRVAFEVRGVETGVLRDNLAALRELLVERLPEDEGARAAGMLDAGAAAIAADRADPPACLIESEGPFAELTERFLDAALNGHREEACAAIRQAADNGVALHDLYTRVLGPAQRELGRLWHLGRLGVQDEHIASVATTTAIAQLHERIARNGHDGRLALGSTVEGDTHDIGVRMACDLLELDGWRAAVLGADTPAEDLVAACERFQPAMVLISATMAIHLPAMRDAVARVREAFGDGSPKILAGGGPFTQVPGLSRALGADDEAATLGEVAAAARRLVPRPD